MTLRSPSPPEGNDFSYQLTENLLLSQPQRAPTPIRASMKIQTPLQQGIPRPKSTPRFVVTSPTNSAMVIEPKDVDSSFNQYLGNHFKQDAPVLLDRLSPSPQPRIPTPTQNDKTSSFWSYLSKDLEGGGHLKDKKTSREHLNGSYNNNTWYNNNGSIFSTTSDMMETNSPFFSVGAFLFLFGFICPPSWWIGSFYPRISRDKMEARWRILNRFFSLGFSILLIIAVIVLAVLYAKN